MIKIKTILFTILREKKYHFKVLIQFIFSSSISVLIQNKVTE